MSGFDRGFVEWCIPGLRIGLKHLAGQHDQSTHGHGGTIKVYHGTNADFDRFEMSPAVSGNEMGQGIYFTTDKNRAKNYGSKVHEVEVSVNNPVDINSEKPIGAGLADKANEYIGHIETVTPNHFETLDEVRTFRNKIGDRLYAMDEEGSGFVVYEKHKGVNANTSTSDFYKAVRQASPQGSSQILEELGFDGIMSDRDVVVFSPNQVIYAK
jgi:hypothetical protein